VAEETLPGMRAVGRVVGILRAFGEGAESLGVSDLARRLGLPKSVVHRILTALVEAHFLEREEATARYRLGPEALALGFAALGSIDLVGMASPYMEELRARTGETVTLSVRVGDERVYVHQLESPQDVRMTVAIGRRWPLYAGASGRAILAGFDDEDVEAYLARTPLTALTPETVTEAVELRRRVEEARAKGYAVSAGERDPWAAAVAVPLMLPNRGVVGALSVCGPRPRLTLEEMEAFAPLLLAAGEAIAERFGLSRVAPGVPSGS
jgi:IclR family acetate operon transcriptional repressor